MFLAAWGKLSTCFLWIFLITALTKWLENTTIDGLRAAAD
jgi:hypothetical protein